VCGFALGSVRGVRPKNVATAISEQMFKYALIVTGCALASCEAEIIAKWAFSGQLRARTATTGSPPSPFGTLRAMGECRQAAAGPFDRSSLVPGPARVLTPTCTGRS
jgi:hypothetical protein